MKRILKNFITAIARNDLAWKIIDRTLIRVSDRLRWERHRDVVDLQIQTQNSFLDTYAQAKNGGPVVMNGPFKGMRYPECRSIGSALTPKLLGSYESEIHPLIEQMCSIPYRAVIDVGCAEGYYAVGFARRITEAIIYAFDIDQNALDLCRGMASLNNVSDRVFTSEQCHPETLRRFPFTGRSLIISDCEGYEKSLFTEDVVPILASHDLLIETHDFLDIEISEQLRKRFENTHSITTISSIDDIQKAKNYQFKELSKFSLLERKTLLAEERPSIMDWLYLTPRKELSVAQF